MQLAMQCIVSRPRMNTNMQSEVACVHAQRVFWRELKMIVDALWIRDLSNPDAGCWVESERSWNQKMRMRRMGIDMQSILNRELQFDVEVGC